MDIRFLIEQLDTISEGWWSNFKTAAQCDKYQSYGVSLAFLNDFIKQIRKNDLDPELWREFKKNIFDKGNLINCPNSTLSEKDKSDLLSLIDETDILFGHIPKNNSDRAKTQELASHILQIRPYITKLYGYENDPLDLDNPLRETTDKVIARIVELSKK